MKSWSLKLRLLSLVGILSLVAIGIFGALQREAMKAVELGKMQSAKRAAEDLLDKLDRNLFERYGDVQAFAVSEPARSGDKNRIVAFMADMMPTYAPIYQLMLVVNTKGKAIAVNAVDKDGKPLDTSSVYANDYSKEVWFKKAITGEIKPATSFVEDLHVDADIKTIYKGEGYAMNFTAPITGPDGQVWGVWTNRVSWADVVEQIVKEQSEALKSPSIPNVLTTIMNPSGMFLLHPEKEGHILTKTQEGFDSLLSELAKGSYVQKREASFSHFTGEVYEATAKSKGYSLYPGIGWYASVVIPTSDPLFTRFLWLGIISASAILITILLGFKVVSSLSKEFQVITTSLASDAQELQTTSGALDGSSQELASGATEQASSLQETASSIEEISAMVNKSSDSAGKASRVASNSQETASKGKETVEQMIQSIQQINDSNTAVMDQFANSNQQLSTIIKVISEIGTKTKVINDIVFQTKLLSFNASVEAARAGEHGKGFAVVAEEVGNLAQMSGNAAKEIGDMLNESISTVQKIVDETKGKVEKLIAESKTKIEEGTAVAKECGLVLEEIVKNESEMNLMINEISTASQEQATGVSEINKAVAELDKVTHRTSSVAQETATQSNRLSSKAEQIVLQVNNLDSIIYGLGKNNAEGKNKGGTKPSFSSAKKATASSTKKPTAGNVIAFAKPAAKKPAFTAPVSELKTAVGSDEQLPSENDPRFDEI